MTLIEHEADEHKYYKMGSHFFSKPESEINYTKYQMLQKVLGDNWQKIRFHNLVRLGGDIHLTGLDEYHKATIMGAFLAYSKSQ